VFFTIRSNPNAQRHRAGSLASKCSQATRWRPGGGLSPDGSRWIACKRGFFLPVRVLSRLFRRLFLDGLAALNKAGRLGLEV
jgi:Putative transposase